MKVCICSSFKFYDQVIKLAELLKQNNIEPLIPIPNSFLINEKEIIKNKEHLVNPNITKTYWVHITDHLKRIDAADFVYIFADNGYVGNGVSLEIGYSHANNKKIISSSAINDLPLSCFIEKVVSPNILVNYLKSQQ